MKYIERPFVCCVAHRHPKFQRNYRFCTGESIVTPTKIDALITQSNDDTHWKPYHTNPNWQIGKILHQQSWPLDPHVSSDHFYVIGPRDMFEELYEVIEQTNTLHSSYLFHTAQEPIFNWLKRYIHSQFIITVPIFKDDRFPNDQWYVSNQWSLNVFTEDVHTIDTPYNQLTHRCYTIGSAWLLLFAMIQLNKIPYFLVSSLLHTKYNEIENSTYVNIAPEIQPFYLGLGIPMICDILEDICKTWFPPDIYTHLFQSPIFTYNDHIEWVYLPNECYYTFDSTLKCLDQKSLIDICQSILTSHIYSDDSEPIRNYPWIYPFLARVVKCSKREWCYWTAHCQAIFRSLHHSYFEKQGSLSHWFHSMTLCLSYLSMDCVKKHRIHQIWKEVLYYMQSHLQVSSSKYFSKLLAHFYTRKLKKHHVAFIPIKFLKSIPLEAELFKPLSNSIIHEGISIQTLYQLIKVASVIDDQASYYIRHLDKRAITKLYSLNNLDSYLVGQVLQHYFKEHRAELFS
jgi:hypothetical protein